MKLAELTWPEIDSLARETPVVLPLGAMEQHSRHLPLLTDTLQLEAIVQALDDRLSTQVLFTPVVWLGNSHHHVEFAGTMSASPPTYLKIIRNLVEGFLGHGFRRIVLLNGHGGNTIPAQQALFEVRQAHRNSDHLLLLLANYWALGDWSHLEVPGLTQSSMQHACQWETSMMLHLHPQLVRDRNDLEPVDYGNPFLPAHRASITRDISREGHVGDPREGLASAGQELVERFTADVAAFLQRVIDWNGTDWNG